MTGWFILLCIFFCYSVWFEIYFLFWLNGFDFFDFFYYLSQTCLCSKHQINFTFFSVRFLYKIGIWKVLLYSNCRNATEYNETGHFIFFLKILYWAELEVWMYETFFCAMFWFWKLDSLLMHSDVYLSIIWFYDANIFLNIYEMKILWNIILWCWFLFFTNKIHEMMNSVSHSSFHEIANHIKDDCRRQKRQKRQKTLVVQIGIK